MRMRSVVGWRLACAREAKPLTGCQDDEDEVVGGLEVGLCQGAKLLNTPKVAELVMECS